MDRAANPYRPGAGTPPPFLAGRDSELTHLSEVMNSARQGGGEQSVVFFGLRGVGKTCLMRAVMGRCEDAGWYAIGGLEGGVGGSFAAFVGTQFARLADQMRGEGVTGKVRHALGVVRSFSLTFGLPALSFGIEVEPAAGYAQSRNLEQDLGDVLSALGAAAAERERGVAVFLDEVQEVEREDLAALIASLHRCNQEQLPVVCVAAGLPHVPVVFSEAKSYAERLFDYRKIDTLSPEEAREALLRPAAAVGVEFEEGAVARILGFAQGYPYFLQLFGREVWSAAEGSPIRLEDAESVLPAVTERLDKSFFESRYERATEAEQGYMRSMARLMRRGSQSVSSAAVAMEAGHASIHSASKVRGELIRKGLIHSERRGRIGFSVPLFADYVRRRARELTVEEAQVTAGGAAG